MTPQTKLSVQTAAGVVQLQVQGLLNVTPNHILASSPDGKWTVRVPKDADGPFSGLSCNPGEALLVSITLTRIAVEEVIEPPTPLQLLKGH